jgi:hypothetical protein
LTSWCGQGKLYLYCEGGRTFRAFKNKLLKVISEAINEAVIRGWEKSRNGTIRKLKAQERIYNFVVRT